MPPQDTESPASPEDPIVAPGVRPIHKYAGLVLIFLLFIASAWFTATFLSDSPGPIQQVAAAAIPDPFDSVMIEAESAYVLDLKTGRVLFSKNADAQLPLASLTKVALVLAVRDALADTSLLIPEHVTPDGAPIRLPSQWRFDAKDVMDFTLVASSNEGAEILASAARESVRLRYPQASPLQPVLWRMNDIAQNLGLAHTYFLNVTGLDLSATQAGAYGSAHDMALLFGHAASTSAHTFEPTTKDELQIRALSGQLVTAENTDSALPVIPGMIVGKTGYTDLAGGNLAVVFEIGPAHPIAAVVLRSTQEGRFSDIEKLITKAQEAIALGH